MTKDHIQHSHNQRLQLVTSHKEKRDTYKEERKTFQVWKNWTAVLTGGTFSVQAWMQLPLNCKKGRVRNDDR